MMAKAASRTGALVLLLGLMSSACEIPPLTRDRLFGARDAAAFPPPDAGPPSPDVAPDVDPPAPDLAPEAAPPVCQAQSRDGLVSGAVFDACTKAAITAYVGIGGQHQCSFSEKGSFHFSGLPVGCQLTLSAGQRGYRPLIQDVVLPPTGLSGLRLELERDGGCGGADPTALTCSCTATGCTSP